MEDQKRTIAASRVSFARDALIYFWGSAPNPAKGPKRVKLSVLRVDGPLSQ